MPGQETAPRLSVEFPTLDGLKLRGLLFPARNYGPAVIITPGFNCVKEMFVPEIAESFQKANVTALVYDPRTLGESDGLPRNNIDPLAQASDYSDALTFLKTQPIVDPTNISFWGMSFSALVALNAAALDKRARCCIAVCPLTGMQPEPAMLPKVLSKCMQDRESQLVGNSPVTLAVLTPDGRNPAGMGIGADKMEYDYMVNAKFRGAPNYENRTTLQSYYKMMAWQPFEIMKYLSKTRVLMIIPEKDTISPAEKQQALFDSLPEPKTAHMAKGKGHLDVLSGADYEALADMQASFVMVPRSK
ncbi:DltD N-terminal domain protein [Penicillium paradoxum]|uniref:DltD N-terminal domain protein n=1 Tax=Penicillium paradoxum TaxID=176176 RepID=UPI002546E4EA|nr:DltD N-terminal domain protein [Penicillium paradoxum]KAJ5773666.1 DltD N-terminal domain protein [Penicillium paradoxum]